MNLSDYLTSDRVLMLKGSTKAAVFDEMIDVLMNSIEGVTREKLTELIYKREEMMSTGVGLGIAVPHVRVEGLENAAIAVGISGKGIKDYESIDGEPVHIIVLIVAPMGRHDLYIKLLAKIVRIVKELPIRDRIIKAEDPSDIYSILIDGNV